MCIVVLSFQLFTEARVLCNHVHTELKFTCLSGLVVLNFLSIPGFVPSLLSCRGGLVVGVRAMYNVLCM